MNDKSVNKLMRMTLIDSGDIDSNEIAFMGDREVEKKFSEDYVIIDVTIPKYYDDEHERFAVKKDDLKRIITTDTSIFDE